MTIDFSGKAVVVTGGGGNLGAAIARGFAASGARVLVHYRSNAAAAAAIATEIQSSGGQAATFAADLSIRADAAQLMDATLNAFGRIDILVNNAGTFPVTPLLEIGAEEWRAVLGANLDSAMYCTQEAALRLRDAGHGGAIINIASVEGTFPKAGHSHYNAAKAGLIMLTRSSAYELGPFGIRVNSVSPGLIARDGIETAWPQGVNAWRATAPLARLGQPEEIADTCLFLASDRAGWITGANVVIDGGASCRPVF